jgi:HPt (histidine-containing phosphotransfer) domain-containing protein
LNTSMDWDTFNTLRATFEQASSGEWQEVLTELLGNMDTVVVELELAAQAGDANRVRRAAHTLKSNAGSLGAVDLAATCREMETLARAESLNDIPELIERMRVEFDYVKRIVSV